MADERKECPSYCYSELAVTGRYTVQCALDVSIFNEKLVNDVVFWPDLASAQYAKRSLDPSDPVEDKRCTKDRQPFQRLPAVTDINF